MQNISANRYPLGSFASPPDKLNLMQARAIIDKLAVYKGRLMKPFDAPVKDFLILPARQADFDRMLKDIEDNKTPFDKAIAPYQENLAILVYSDSLADTNKPNHCSLDYFLKQNAINLDDIKLH